MRPSLSDRLHLRHHPHPGPRPTTRRHRGGRSRNPHNACRELVCLPLLRGSLHVPRTVPARSVMGAVAFVVLMSAEVGLAVLVFGQSATEHIESYESVPAAIGLAAQIVFATFPVAQVWGR